MPFVILPTNSASGGYDITNSLRFNSGSSDSLTRTPASTSGNQTFTVSFWVKRSQIGVGDTIFYAYQDGNNANALGFSGSDQFQVAFYDSGAYSVNLITTQLFRDVSAWYHLVVVIDTTQATASNRAKLYVNGTQVTAFGTETYPSQNATVTFNKNVFHVIGSGYYGSFSDYSDLYLSEVNWITGQALTPSSFGETDTDTGIWKPKAYTGTYGTNGFYLQFKNSASLGTDSSGNGNTFTVNNLTSIDQTTDTPTNNFATGNPLSPYTNRTITEGNLLQTSTTTAWTNLISSISVSAGKWYIEAKATAGLYHSIGIVDTASYFNNENSSIGDYTISNQQIGYYSNTGTKKVNQTTSAYGSTWTNGDVIGIALDLDNNFIYFSKNGTFQNSGVPTSGSSGTGGISVTSGIFYAIAVAVYNSSAMSFNFGSPSYSANSYTDSAGRGNFSYSVPSGYYSLCTANLSLYG
jgi:hypothetical protein